MGMGETLQGEDIQWEEKAAWDKVNVLIYQQKAGCWENGPQFREVMMGKKIELEPCWSLSMENKS